MNRHPNPARPAIRWLTRAFVNPNLSRGEHGQALALAAVLGLDVWLLTEASAIMLGFEPDRTFLHGLTIVSAAVAGRIYNALVVNR